MKDFVRLPFNAFVDNQVSFGIDPTATVRPHIYALIIPGVPSKQIKLWFVHNVLDAAFCAQQTMSKDFDGNFGKEA